MFKIKANTIERFESVYVYLKTLDLVNKGIDFPSAIARERGVETGTAMEQISFLREGNFLERGKRDKAQHYVLTKKGKDFLKRFGRLLRTIEQERETISMALKKLREVYT